MTRDDIAAVLDREPRLSAYGMGLYNGVPRSQGEEMFRRHREELRNDVDGCTRAASWVARQARNKTAGADLCRDRRLAGRLASAVGRAEQRIRGFGHAVPRVGAARLPPGQG
jgi:hypothetical protein